jgi:undecaprenyl-diphosphatase
MIMKKIGNKLYKFLLHLNSSQTFILLFSEILLGIFLSILSFLFFTKIARNVLNDNYFNLDVIVSQLIYGFRDPFLTQVMKFVSFLGQDIVLIPFSVIFFMFLAKKYRHEAVLFLFAIITGFLINFAIKFFIARPRPSLSPLFIESFHSFPSGHAMNSVIVYGIFAFFIFRFTRNKTLSSIAVTVCIVLVTLIGISRVYLGVHYPTDVIAGLIGGLWWIVTVLLAEKIIIFFHLFRKRRGR